MPAKLNKPAGEGRRFGFGRRRTPPAATTTAAPPPSTTTTAPAARISAPTKLSKPQGPRARSSSPEKKPTAVSPSVAIAPPAVATPPATARSRESSPEKPQDQTTTLKPRRVRVPALPSSLATTSSPSSPPVPSPADDDSAPLEPPNRNRDRILSPPPSTVFSLSPSLKDTLMATAAYAAASPTSNPANLRDSWATNTTPGLAGLGARGLHVSPSAPALPALAEAAAADPTTNGQTSPKDHLAAARAATFGPTTPHPFPTMRSPSLPPHSFPSSPPYPSTPSHSHSQSQQFLNHHMRPPTLSSPTLASTALDRPLAHLLTHSIRADSLVPTRARPVDKVDVLDVTDPWGMNWHHGSPYDIVPTATGTAGGSGKRSGRATPVGANSPLSPPSRSRIDSAAPSPLSKSTTASQLSLPLSPPDLTLTLNPSTSTPPLSSSPPKPQPQATRSRISLDPAPGDTPGEGDLLGRAAGSVVREKEDREDRARLLGEVFQHDSSKARNRDKDKDKDVKRERRKTGLMGFFAGVPDLSNEKENAKARPAAQEEAQNQNAPRLQRRLSKQSPAKRNSVVLGRKDSVRSNRGSIRRGKRTSVLLENEATGDQNEKVQPVVVMEEKEKEDSGDTVRPVVPVAPPSPVRAQPAMVSSPEPMVASSPVPLSPSQVPLPNLPPIAQTQSSPTKHAFPSSPPMGTVRAGSFRAVRERKASGGAASRMNGEGPPTPNPIPVPTPIPAMQTLTTGPAETKRSGSFEVVRDRRVSGQRVLPPAMNGNANGSAIPNGEAQRDTSPSKLPLPISRQPSPEKPQAQSQAPALTRRTSPTKPSLPPTIASTPTRKPTFFSRRSGSQVHVPLTSTGTRESSNTLATRATSSGGGGGGGGFIRALGRAFSIFPRAKRPSDASARPAVSFPLQPPQAPQLSPTTTRSVTPDLLAAQRGRLHITNPDAISPMDSDRESMRAREKPLPENGLPAMPMPVPVPVPKEEEGGKARVQVSFPSALAPRIPAGDSRPENARRRSSSMAATPSPPSTPVAVERPRQRSGSLQSFMLRNAQQSGVRPQPVRRASEEQQQPNVYAKATTTPTEPITPPRPRSRPGSGSFASFYLPGFVSPSSSPEKPAPAAGPRPTEEQQVNHVRANTTAAPEVRRRSGSFASLLHGGEKSGRSSEERARSKALAIAAANGNGDSAIAVRPGGLSESERTLSSTSLRDLGYSVVQEPFHAPAKEPVRTPSKAEYHSSAMEYRKSYRSPAATQDSPPKAARVAAAAPVIPAPAPVEPISIPSWAQPPAPVRYAAPPPPQSPPAEPTQLSRGQSTETIRGMGKQWAMVDVPPERRPVPTRRASNDRTETYHTLAEMGVRGRQAPADAGSVSSRRSRSLSLEQHIPVAKLREMQQRQQVDESGGGERPVMRYPSRPVGADRPPRPRVNSGDPTVSSVSVAPVRQSSRRATQIDSRDSYSRDSSTGTRTRVNSRPEPPRPVHRPTYVRQRSTSIDSVMAAIKAMDAPRPRQEEYHGYGHARQPQPPYRQASTNGPNYATSTRTHIVGPPNTRSNSQRAPSYGGELQPRGRQVSGSYSRPYNTAPAPVAARPTMVPSNSAPAQMNLPPGHGSSFTSFSLSAPFAEPSQQSWSSAQNGQLTSLPRVIPAPNTDWMRLDEPRDPRGPPLANDLPPPPRASYYHAVSSADYWKAARDGRDDRAVVSMSL